jgi:adenylylsulfate kinase-like enzyme
MALVYVTGISGAGKSTVRGAFLIDAERPLADVVDDVVRAVAG